MTERDSGSPVSAEDLELRGHHFSTVLDVACYGAETVIDHLTAKLERARGNNTSNTVDLDRLAQNDFRDDPAYPTVYAVDLIGDNARQTEAFRGKTVESINRLTDCADAATVTFTMKPDAICASCVFGRHCRRPDIADSDARAIYALGQISEGLNLGDRVKVSGKPEDSSYKLASTAGVVRAVMRHFVDADRENPARAFAKTRDNVFYEPLKRYF